MSKANFSRRKKLLYNIFHSDLSGSDKVIYYAMFLKYIDGEQLLEYITKNNPTNEQLIEYIEERLNENRVKHGEEKATD